MSIKKTSSPLSSGAEALEPLGGKEEILGKKVDSDFESALANLAGEIEQAGDAAQISSPTRSTFREIAARTDLESKEGALSAVRESAQFLIKSRLKENLRDSGTGKKISGELGDYIAKDPFMHRKILAILKNLK